jgi:hypothetical protein
MRDRLHLPRLLSLSSLSPSFSSSRLRTKDVLRNLEPCERRALRDADEPAVALHQRIELGALEDLEERVDVDVLRVPRAPTVVHPACVGHFQLNEMDGSVECRVCCGAARECVMCLVVSCAQFACYPLRGRV